MPTQTSKPEKEMIRSSKSGNVARVQELLEQIPTLIDARDTDGSTPLHCAAWKGHKEVAALLLSHGADVNAQNANTHWGGTPLHAAAHANQRAIAELLLQHGADSMARSCNGRTPLEETAIHNASAVANLLKRHEATGTSRVAGLHPGAIQAEADSEEPLPEGFWTGDE
jgi:ankyrin repeat protein